MDKPKDDYEFFTRDGVEHVRIQVGIDVVERPATKEDHEAAKLAKASRETLEREEKARAEAQQKREQENADRVAGKEPKRETLHKPEHKAET